MQIPRPHQEILAQSPSRVWVLQTQAHLGWITLLQILPNGHVTQALACLETTGNS